MSTRRLLPDTSQAIVPMLTGLIKFVPYRLPRNGINQLLTMRWLVEGVVGKIPD